MIVSKVALLFVLASPIASVFGQTGTYCDNAGFDDGSICSKPKDILDPATECDVLPDCPAWCDPDAANDYCGSTTLIDGAVVNKYMTELFLPPVLINSNGDQNSVAIREFLQQILPADQGYPKTRLWGYGKYSQHSLLLLYKPPLGI